MYSVRLDELCLIALARRNKTDRPFSTRRLCHITICEASHYRVWVPHSTPSGHVTRVLDSRQLLKFLLWSNLELSFTAKTKGRIPEGSCTLNFLLIQLLEWLHGENNWPVKVCQLYAFNVAYFECLSSEWESRNYIILLNCVRLIRFNILSRRIAKSQVNIIYDWYLCLIGCYQWYVKLNSN